MEPDRWVERLTRASERFPRILTPDLTARIHDLPEKVTLALDQLRDGPASWTHIDAHLDNVLWRADGSAVLLDWCNAAIGPPAADLARFLSEGVEAASKPALMSTYLRELGSSGAAHVGLAEFRVAIELALLPLLQSAVGWAGREDLASRGRLAAVSENWLRSVCIWAFADRHGSHVGSKGV